MNTTGSSLGPRHAGLARSDLNASDQRRNHREIESIARQLERPLSEIAELYASVYADLKSRAQVFDYLPVLVARKVRACYHTENAPVPPTGARIDYTASDVPAGAPTH